MENSEKDIIDKVINKFIEIVLPSIDQDKIGKLTNEKKNKIEKGKDIDPRPSRFLSTSGKGGSQYPEYINISLLDHSTSVARGSSIFALNDLYDGENEDFCLKIMSTCFIVGIFHDLDKLYKSNVNLDLVKKAFENYNIKEYLNYFNVDINEDIFFKLIQSVESRTSQQSSNTIGYDVYFKAISTYVRFSDKLDSMFLKKDFDGINKILSSEDTFSNWNKKQPAWELIKVYNPYHFLVMEKFRSLLSNNCEKLTGLTPIFSIYLDGHMMVFLPKNKKDEIIQNSFNEISKFFSSSIFKFKLGKDRGNNLTPVNKGEFMSINELKESVTSNIISDKLYELISIKSETFEKYQEEIKNIILELNFEDEIEYKNYKKLCILQDDNYPFFDDICNIVSLIGLVGLKPDNNLENIENKINFLEQKYDIPEWVKNIESLRCKVVLTCLFSYIENPDIIDELENFMYGNETIIGLKTIFDKSSQKNYIIEKSLEELLSMVNGDSILREGNKTCLITGTPTDVEQISTKDEIYSIKSSSFSNRTGRLKHIYSGKSETHLSELSYIEFKYRGNKFGIKTGPSTDSVQCFISSPITTGLFGSIHEGNIDDFDELNLYDLSREKIENGKKVYASIDRMKKKSFFLRQYSIPEKTEDSISDILQLLKIVRKTGRPLHIFKGIPEIRNEIFYIDSIPSMVKSILNGKNGIFLDEINEVINVLETFKMCNDTLNSFSTSIMYKFLTSNKPIRKLGLLCEMKNKLMSINETYLSLRINDLIDNIIYKEIKDMNDIPEKKMAEIISKIQFIDIYNYSPTKYKFFLQEALNQLKKSKYDLKLKNKESLIAAISSHLNSSAHRRSGDIRNISDLKLQELTEKFSEIFINEIIDKRLNFKYPVHSETSTMLNKYMHFLSEEAKNIIQLKSKS